MYQKGYGNFTPHFTGQLVEASKGTDSGGQQGQDMWPDYAGASQGARRWSHPAPPGLGPPIPGRELGIRGRTDVCVKSHNGFSLAGVRAQPSGQGCNKRGKWALSSFLSSSASVGLLLTSLASAHMLLLP